MHQQGADTSAQSRQHLNSHARALGLSHRESLAMVAVWVHTWSLSAVLQGVAMGSLIRPVVRHMLHQQSMSTPLIKGSSAGLIAVACSQLPAADISRHGLLNQRRCNVPCRLWAPTADGYRDTLALEIVQPVAACAVTLGVACCATWPGSGDVLYCRGLPCTASYAL